jgi:hypothetical protein
MAETGGFALSPMVAQAIEPLMGIRALNMGANPLSFQGMQPWQVGDAHPERVGQGINAGLNTVLGAVQQRQKDKKAEALQEKADKIDKEKTQWSRFMDWKRLQEQSRQNDMVNARARAKEAGISDDADADSLMGGKVASSVVKKELDDKHVEDVAKHVDAPMPSDEEQQRVVEQVLKYVTSPEAKDAPMTLAGVSGGGPAAVTQKLSFAPNAGPLSGVYTPGMDAAFPPETQQMGAPKPAAAAPVMNLAAATPKTMQPPQAAPQRPPAPTVKDLLRVAPPQARATPSPTTASGLPVPAETSKDDAPVVPPATIAQREQSTARNPNLPMLATFKDGKKAYEWVKHFNSHGNPEFVANVKTANGKFFVEYENAKDAQASANLKEQKWELAKKTALDKAARQEEGSLASQAKDFNADPTIKAMNDRPLLLTRFMPAAKMIMDDLSGKTKMGEVSRRTVDLEAIDAFVQFASGRVPTEGQYHEVQDYTQGFLSDLRQKIWKGEKGARLSPSDINTMKSLMLETYNSTATRANAHIGDLRKILSKKHPDLMEEQMPRPYPILEVDKHWRSQISKLDAAIGHTEELLKKYASEKDKASSTAAQEGLAALRARRVLAEKNAKEAEQTGLPTNWHVFENPQSGADLGGWLRGNFGAWSQNPIGDTVPQ